MFAGDQLSDDKFLGGRLHLLQPLKGYRAATDPVCWPPPARRNRAKRARPWLRGGGCGALPRDAGAGTGAGRAGTATGYADLARQNAGRNGIAVEVHEGDLAHMPRALRRDFDHVIANPPYYPAGRQPLARCRPCPGDAGRNAALRLGPGRDAPPASRRLADADLRRRWPARGACRPCPQARLCRCPAAGRPRGPRRVARHRPGPQGWSRILPPACPFHLAPGSGP
jgi:hypothetical protein